MEEKPFPVRRQIRIDIQLQDFIQRIRKTHIHTVHSIINRQIGRRHCRFHPVIPQNRFRRVLQIRRRRNMKILCVQRMDSTAVFIEEYVRERILNTDVLQSLITVLIRQNLKVEIGLFIRIIIKALDYFRKEPVFHGLHNFSGIHAVQFYPFFRNLQSGMICIGMVLPVVPDIVQRFRPIGEMHLGNIKDFTAARQTLHMEFELASRLIWRAFPRILHRNLRHVSPVLALQDSGSLRAEKSGFFILPERAKSGLSIVGKAQIIEGTVSPDGIENRRFIITFSPCGALDVPAEKRILFIRCIPGGFPNKRILKGHIHYGRKLGRFSQFSISRGITRDNLRDVLYPLLSASVIQVRHREVRLHRRFKADTIRLFKAQAEVQTKIASRGAVFYRILQSLCTSCRQIREVLHRMSAVQRDGLFGRAIQVLYSDPFRFINLEPFAQFIHHRRIINPGMVLIKINRPAYSVSA